MNRREFLTYAGGAAVGVALSGADRTSARGSTRDSWRTFEVITRVEILKPSGPTRIWLPAALPLDTPFQRTLANEFKAEEAGPSWLVAKRMLSESSRPNFRLEPSPL